MYTKKVWNLLLIEIFNGIIFFKTIQVQWNGWCENYFNKTQVIIVRIPHTFKPSLNDSWLAGLFDATGSVKLEVSTPLPDKSVSINQCLIFYHKDVKAEFEYLNKLIKGEFLKKDANGSLIIVNYQNVESIAKYFSIFNLYTVKAESMKRWLDIHNSRVSNLNFNANTKGYCLVKRNAAFIKFNTKLVNIRHYSQLSPVLIPH